MKKIIQLFKYQLVRTCKRLVSYEKDVNGYSFSTVQYLLSNKRVFYEIVHTEIKDTIEKYGVNNLCKLLNSDKINYGKSVIDSVSTLFGGMKNNKLVVAGHIH